MAWSSDHAVTSGVPRTATLCANYVVRDVGFILTLPRAVVCGAAIRARGQHAVLAESAVQHGELPQLHLPQLVRALWQIDPLLDYFFDLGNCFLHLTRFISLNVSVKGFILPRHWLITNLHLPLLHASLASDHNLTATHLFHGFQRIASGPDEQSHKVETRMILLWYHDFICYLDRGFIVVRRLLVVRVDRQHFHDRVVPGLFQFCSFSNIAGVLSFSHSIINRLRTWRSVLGIWRDTKVATAQSPTGLFYLQL